METRANYLLVGGFVLALMAGLVAFVLWFAKVQFDTDYARYDIYFDGRVTGLTLGSSVSYRGVPVGEVTFVGIDPENVERVLVTIEVPANTPIKTDTIASLEIQGITGGALVLLSGGTQAAPDLRLAPGQARAVIASTPSRLEQFLQGAPELVASFNVLVGRAIALLSADNQAAFAATLDNLSVVTGAVANRTDDIELLINDASGVMGELRDLGVALNDLAQNLSVNADRLAARTDDTLAAVGAAARTLDRSLGDPEGEVLGLVQDMRQASQSITAMSGQIEQLVAENRQPLADFSNKGLYDFSNFLTEARALILGLNRVTTEVERDPARFLFGNQQQGYETPR